MGILEGFGYKIYRLREGDASNEFLVYDINKNSYNLYNILRLVSILKKELEEKDIYVNAYIKKVLNYDDTKNYDEKKIINSWVDQEYILIDNLGFKPTKERIFKRRKKIYFNLYNSLDTLNKDNYLLDKPMNYKQLCELAPDIISLFNNLHGFRVAAIKNTLYKIADKIQYPHEKPQDAIIFYPGEAAGKGIFYKYILEPIFQDYACKTLMKNLDNDFNGFLYKNLVLVLEEGKMNKNLIEITKEITTEPSIMINEKGKDQRQEQVYFLTFVFSNNMNPIDLGKRRGSYHHCHSLGSNIEESQTKGADLCLKIPNQLKYLLQYLHNLKVNHQQALLPFNTLAKEQVNDLNKTVVELFYDDLLSYENIETYIKSKNNSFEKDVFFSYENIENEVYISKDIFKQLYNNFCIENKFRTNLITHNKDIVQLWALFNLPQEASKRLYIVVDGDQTRRIDHINLDMIDKHISKKYKEVNV